MLDLDHSSMNTNLKTKKTRPTRNNIPRRANRRKLPGTFNSTGVIGSFVGSEAVWAHPAFVFAFICFGGTVAK